MRILGAQGSPARRRRGESSGAGGASLAVWRVHQGAAGGRVAHIDIVPR